jgi:hypothetical protein
VWWERELKESVGIGWFNNPLKGRNKKMGNGDKDHVNLPSMNAVDTDLDVVLTIDPQEAQGRVEGVALVLAAREPEIMGKLLAGIEEAEKSKRSASDILGWVKKAAGLATKIISPL